MNRTKIEWTDYTWNPLIGCSRQSPGCANCYALRISRRHASNPTLPDVVRDAHHNALTSDRRDWTGQVRLILSRLDEPYRVRKPARIFVCSVSDIYHPHVLPSWRSAIFERIRRCPQHTFQLLTKRPGPAMMQAPPEAWHGVTVESQRFADRVSDLAAYSPGCSVRFVSCEPMLGPIDLSAWLERGDLQWVIAGPETGSGRRPFDAEWIDGQYGLAAQCRTYGVAFFDKRPGPDRTRQFPQPRRTP